MARELAFLRVLACPSHSENRSHDPGLVGPIGLPISIQEAPLLYAISPTDEISLIGRLPRDVEQLQSEGWRFLASAAWWDSDDLERLAQATGLAAISPSYGQVASQKWWKAYAKSYLNKRDPVAAVEAVGEPAFNIGPREESISAPRETVQHVGDPLVASRWTSGLQEWSVQLSSDDLMWRINVLHVLRLARKAHLRLPSRLSEITLSARESELVCRGEGLPFQMPARGTWPSPVAVNAKRFIEVVREVLTPLIHLVFGGHRLWVNGVRSLPGRSDRRVGIWESP